MLATKVFAAPAEYTPISGLNWLRPQDDMKDFFNHLYLVSIFIASISAVIIIAVHGFRYMIQDLNPFEKADHIQKIKNALLGLILLLAIHLILYQIDPDIVSLRVLKN